ncbi:MAG: hypothetical protein ACFB0D_03550 [Phormidesmis sp.]
MPRRKQKSLVDEYFDRWELPFCLFITVDVIAHFLFLYLGRIAGFISYFAWLMLPTAFIFGIAIAAAINFERKRPDIGLLNAITAVLSFPILGLPLFVVRMVF